MKTIKTNCFGITVELDEQGGNTISSDLKENCTHCGQASCHHDCDGSQGADEPHERDDERDEFNAAVDGLESMILACACHGIDITTPAFLAAIETTVDAISNKYGE